MRKYMSKSSLVYRLGRNIAGQFTTLYLRHVYIYKRAHCVRGNGGAKNWRNQNPRSTMETVQSSALNVEHLDNGKYGNQTYALVD